MPTFRLIADFLLSSLLESVLFLIIHTMESFVQNIPHPGDDTSKYDLSSIEPLYPFGEHLFNSIPYNVS